MIMARIRKGFAAIADRATRRLVNKLILLFTTIIVLVVGSLTIISYQMTQRESVESSIKSTTNNLYLVNKNIEGYLAGIEVLSQPQLRYDEIMHAIKNEAEDYASRQYLENYLRDLFFSRSDLEAIYFYLVNEDRYYTIYREAYTISSRTGTDAEITGLNWYKQMMQSKQNRAYQSFLTAGEETGYAVNTEHVSMAFHKVLRSIATREPQAVLSFYFNPKSMEAMMKDVPLTEGEHVLLLDPSHKLFYADDLPFYADAADAELTTQLTSNVEAQFNWDMEDERYMVVHNAGQVEGWSLVKPIPYREIYEAATKTRNVSYLIGVLFLVIAVILVALTANAITMPLGRLSVQMRRFSEGTFDAAAPVKGRDEIAYLTRRFNHMVVRTNELINERYKMKLVEKNAMLKALEAEINPHFLYNALQAISTKALKAGTDDVADMVDALALTLRYCISGKDIVQAHEELQHIERYLALQKARFGSRLHVVTEWDGMLHDLRIPKLSLQTLVENAIKHGVERVSSPVTVLIQARAEDEQAVIVVEDDGPGLTPARLAEVQRQLAAGWDERETDSIGLHNLHTRLKLLYGDTANLTIEAKERGARLTMTLPRGG
ncbi:two-component system sensor histidine kinase YesM [Paenibacillus phyllosphaerae]|uniref:Two-component system sensor histidine kinase YesM n=1 Tax=Paenibacillus phyllosphaerae TaxID=274593 RepID=A0A7W5FQZ3_9BACL|nr:histidine kinase [Paenibacillus phyllosphaerae]MBB3113981.1 two-component system sensor histidine kinase YesM [Paenibacillus phyllosphaerae]